MPTVLSRFCATCIECLFPPVCLQCGRPLLGEAPGILCADCHAGLNFIGAGACRFCGAVAGAYAELDKGCADCRRSQLSFTRATAVATYGQPERALIRAFKFEGNRRLAAPLGELMAGRMKAAGFPEDFAGVMPVPLHPRRWRERGYNQSELLAKEISRRWRCRLRTDILQRVRHTRSQALLPYRLRLTNPVGAFRAEGDLEGATMLLVDDIMTTGATVSECARMLRAAGAQRVYVAVFGR